MACANAYVLPHPPIIVPAVGKGEEAPAARTIEAYRMAADEIVAARPDVLVVSSPHAPLLRDGFYLTTCERAVGDMAQFRAYGTSIEAQVDVELAQAIAREGESAGIAFMGSGAVGAETLDHGTYVPLYFVCEAAARAAGELLPDGTLPNGYALPFKIVRLGMSGLPPRAHGELGGCIDRAASGLNRRYAYLASGDLAHRLSADGPYGFDPAAPVLEEAIVGALERNDLPALFGIDPKVRDAAGDCGARSFMIMAGAVGGYRTRCEVLSHEYPFGIGYCVARVACAPKEGE